MLTTWSFNSSWSALIRLTVILGAPVARSSELEPGRSRRVGHRLDAPVIEVAPAVEHRLVQSLPFQTLRDQGAHLLRRLDVAGAAPALADLESRGLRQRGAPLV